MRLTTSASETLSPSARARSSSATSEMSCVITSRSRPIARACSELIDRPNWRAYCCKPVIIKRAELLDRDLGPADLGHGRAAEAAEDVADSPDGEAQDQDADNGGHHGLANPVGRRFAQTSKHKPSCRDREPQGRAAGGQPRRLRIIGSATSSRNTWACGTTAYRPGKYGAGVASAALLTGWPGSEKPGMRHARCAAPVGRGQLEDEWAAGLGVRAGPDHCGCA